MASYRIICTVQTPFSQPHSHAHITQVGIGNESGYSQLLTVSQVYAHMDAGHAFYTQSPSTGAVASVHKYNCSHCQAPTLRSGADAVTDNNLDNLSRCKV